MRLGLRSGKLRRIRVRKEVIEFIVENVEKKNFLGNNGNGALFLGGEKILEKFWKLWIFCFY